MTSNIYHRGAIYWWRQTVRLAPQFDRPTMIRVALRTAELADAWVRAAWRETERTTVEYNVNRSLMAGLQTDGFQAVYEASPALDYVENHIKPHYAIFGICNLHGKRGINENYAECSIRRAAAIGLKSRNSLPQDGPCPHRGCTTCRLEVPPNACCQQLRARNFNINTVS